jgi:5-methylcytosine-specific restriction endonuclease McrA
MNGRVLVLNSTYEPINVCTTRRAIVLILKGIARAEERHDDLFHSARQAMAVPSVIRLTEYVHIPFERKSLSRKNILLRDHNTCQYCGRISTPSELTLDHVIPIGTTSSPVANAATIGKAARCRKRWGCGCSNARRRSASMSIARSCAISAAATRNGENISFMNRR